MGNILTKGDVEKKEDVDLIDKLNLIATKLITTSRFEELLNLKDKRYCDGLIVITSDILDKYFTNNEISYIKKELSDEEKDENEYMYFSLKQDSDKFLRDNYGEGSSDILDKKHKCLLISKYYIKISHIYAAIMTAVNPVYNINGKKVGLMDKNINNKDELPIKKDGLCERRQEILQKNKEYLEILQEQISENKVKKRELVKEPEHCKMDNSRDVEPVIQDLSNLYKDIYNEVTGEFDSMSEDAREKYTKDLKEFYEGFTGREMDASINDFTDIKLSTFNKNTYCAKKYNRRNNHYIDDETENNLGSLIEVYGTHLAKSINSANEKQNKLTEILDDLFEIEESGLEVIIRRDLKYDDLNNIVSKTTSALIELYTSCERDFKKGISIFEGIVLSKNIEMETLRSKGLQEGGLRLYNRTFQNKI
ncbi:MAG: hypothetical protein CMF80_06745 [Candidatus Marinimicrobia bacterium]|nr:hypothetical protein [Candidatus Neomarinimicrobiota bacterium]|tara:strand:+ start:88 stop:1353 length:1266 start_codon:yes stop_codon:yes gene_type:complete